MKVLVDTNIFVRCAQRGHPERGACLRAVDQLLETGHDLAFCAQVAIEFWAVATRPAAANGLGFSIEQTESALRDADESMACLPEPPALALLWRQLVNRYEVRGRQAHDARLVAFMLSHGISRVLTLNTQDFARYTEITTLHPTDVP